VTARRSWLSEAGEFWRLPEPELQRMAGLARTVDCLELKLAVPPAVHVRTCAALEVDLDRARARQVSFLDTRDLALARKGVLMRIRSIEDRPDDSVVKLRPVVPGALPARLRRSKRFLLEIDGMPGGYLCSGAVKARLGSHAVARATAGERSPRSLFSESQRAFVSAQVSAGVDIDDLLLLGPIHVRRRKVTVDGIGVPLKVERWTYPDGSQLLELSTRCPGDLALEVAAETAASFRARGLCPAATQGTKARAALDFFSRQAAD
jgi:hypothetical protein